MEKFFHALGGFVQAVTLIIAVAALAGVWFVLEHPQRGPMGLDGPQGPRGPQGKPGICKAVCPLPLR